MQLRWVNPLASSFGRRVMSVAVAVSLGGGAFHFKKTYNPGPLSGAHRLEQPVGGYHSHADFEQECMHCHAPVHCIDGNRCQECHIEIARQRAEADGLHGILPGTGRCNTCHVEHQGRDAIISRFPLSNVDHARLTGFSLARHQQDHEGVALVCVDCHTRHSFKAEAVDCISCHVAGEPELMAEHTALYGEDCLQCHDGYDRTAGFNHEEVFPLQDGHAIEDCAECHADQTFANPARDCLACHEDPEVHAGKFGLDCSRCHSTVNWTETRLTRHTFRLDHGGEGEVACETCHIESYVAYTCYECHDHDPEQMREVHAQEEITEFENCNACHPTGGPGEGEQYHDGS